MKQIEETGYADALRSEDVEHIHKYGIAFYKKNCRIIHEEEVLE